MYKAENEKDTMLLLIKDGHHLMSVTDGAMAGFFEHDELITNDEYDLVGDFFQNFQDWNDILGDIGIKGRLDAEKNLTEEINNLYQNGLALYAGLLDRKINFQSQIEPFPTSVLRVVRMNNKDYRKT